MNFLQRLIDTVRRVGVRPHPVAEFSPETLREPARAPIRARIMLACGVLGLLAMLGVWKIGNPIARVLDPRVVRDYRSKPLTSLASGEATSHIWLGSAGEGIRIYDPDYHFFLPEITRKSSRGMLLGDHILSLDFRGPLAAIAATDASGHAGGAQIAKLDGSDTAFWSRQSVDLSTFPGLSDETASAVVETGDHARLFIGTRDAGIGVYEVTTHSWSAIIKAPQIPSNRITDLAIFTGAGSRAMLWLATDHGLCAGRLDGSGKFVVARAFGLADGLAGEDVRRLKVGEGCVWYRTAGQGFGRVMLDEAGAPRAGECHELLVSERKLDGVSDAGLRLAASSPAGPTTWFLAVDGGRRLLGRYREQPHDTTGLVLPPEFPFDRFTCLATEAETGQGVILGTDDGAWLYRERLIDGGDSAAITFNQLSAITGGNIGPAGQRVDEAALGSGIAVAKTKIGNAPYALLRTNVSGRDATPWQPLVGSGRFPNLGSLREVTSAAQSGSRVYFGTAGKGIGTWDHDAMEVRRTHHTTEKDPEHRLRNDTTLDLAAAGTEVFQVTGDKAVDVLGGVALRSLIPPDSAPFTPVQLNTVAADGTRLAAAGAGHVGFYDGRAFSWRETAPLPGLAQLHLTSGTLWGRTERQELHALTGTGSSSAWKMKLEGVFDLATTSNALCAVRSDASGVNALTVLDGTGGNVKLTVQPTTLGPVRDAWKFAAVFARDLLLAGSGRDIHRYALNERQWKAVPVASTVQPPYRTALRTAGSWWLLDSARSLYRFDGAAVGDKHEPEVEKIAAAGSLLVARLSGNRWVQFDDQWQRKVLVGDAFAGDLAHVTAAAERPKDLVVLADGALGIYEPESRHWRTVRSIGGSLDRLYSAGDAIWVASGRQLFSLAADGSLQPVLAENQPIEPRQVATDGQALWVLAQNGALWRVAAGRPTEPVLRVVASKVPGTATPSPLGLFRNVPLFFDGQQFLTFAGAPERWQAQPTNARPAHFSFGTGGDRLVGWNNDQAWNFSGVGTAGNVQERPMLPASLAGRARVLSASVTETEAACLVRITGEEALKVVAMRGTNPGNSVPGTPLPRGTPTVSYVREVGGILRLDQAGKVGFYEQTSRSWQTENTPGAFDEIWSDARSIYGYHRSTGLLAVRGDDRRWTVLAQKATGLVRTPGALAWKGADGAWAWRNPDGGSSALFVPPTGRPSLSGPIVQALEWNGRLLIRDNAGHAATYEPVLRRWENLPGGPVFDIKLDSTFHQPIVLMESAGRRRLFALTQPQSGLVATPLVANPLVSVRSFASGSRIVLILGTDQRVYWILDGKEERVPGLEGVTALWPIQGGFAVQKGSSVFHVAKNSVGEFVVTGQVKDAPQMAATPEPTGFTQWEFSADKGGELAYRPRGIGGVGRMVMKLRPLAGWDFEEVTEVRLNGTQAWLHTPVGWRALQRNGTRFDETGLLPEAPANALTDALPASFTPADAGGRPMVFDPRFGHFDTDVILGLGSGGGHLWALTLGGLEKLSDHSRQSLPEGLVAGELQFGKDGELVDSRGRTQVVWSGAAWTAGQTPKAPAVSAGIWQYDAASGYRRARPQEADRFDPVSLNAQRRWNFEEITALSANEGFALLGTDGGPAVAAAAGNGLVAAWPRDTVSEHQPARAVFDGARWLRESDRQPFTNNPVPREGGQFRWSSAAPGRPLQFVLPGDDTPAPVQGGRFSRDLVYDACPAPGGIAVSTAAGLGTLRAQGAGISLVPESAGKRFDFVPTANAVFARPAAQGTPPWALRGGNWAECPAAEADAATAEASRNVAEGEPWRVIRGGTGDLEFAVRLGGPAGGDYRTVPFISARGTFGFDLFRSVARGAAADEWIVGTEAGLITIGADGVLKRLWCDPSADGVGAEPVVRMVRAEDGALLARTDRRMLSLRPGTSAFQQTTAEAFNAALAVLANDPQGWQIIQQAERAFRFRWAGQPVTLVPWQEGRSRFAHNVIHSVAVDTRHLFLGTEGGLLRVRRDSSNTTDLLVDPFSPGGRPPEPLTWLSLEGSRMALRGKSGAAWEVDLTEFKSVPVVAARPVAAEVAKDELLRWRHPGPGAVEVTFQPGRTMPADLAPAVADGTFTFLNLDIEGAAKPPSTLCQTPAGFFWLTKAGVVHYDAKTSQILRIHARTSDLAAELTTLSTLHWDVLRKKLFAGREQAQVEFDGNVWKPLAADSSGSDLALVGDSARLSWRQEDGRVKVTVKQTDDPSRPFFGAGRPQFDEVLDFALDGGESGKAVLLATSAGIVEYEPTEFSWAKMRARAFQGKPVNSLAVAQTGDAKRQCARTEGGDFEFDGSQWQPGADAAAVFARDQERVNWPDMWTWSQRPKGLACNFLNTNIPGKPFLTGTAAGGPALFSREKLALDDVRAALLSEGELLLATPLGCARYRLDPKASTSAWHALDAWREDPAGTALGPLTGLAHFNQEILALSEAGAARMNPTQPRTWRGAGQLVQDLERRHLVADGRAVWEVMLTGKPNEVAITYGSSGSGMRWYSDSKGGMPDPDTDPSKPKASTLRASAVSPHGLWFLLGNDLYHASRQRSGRSIKNWISFKTPLDPVPK